MLLYDKNGNLVSRIAVEEVLGKIKRNYDGCKQNGMLHELVHGKWKNSFRQLIDEASSVASKYCYEVVVGGYIILENEHGNALKAAYKDIIITHGTEINRAVTHGDMEALDKVLMTCSEEFIPYYQEYRENDADALTEYVGTLFVNN